MNDWFEAEQHVERAHEHFEAGRWEEAESELRAAIAHNPYQAEWHFNLGLTLDAAGRHQEAFSAFCASAELDDSHPQACLLAGLNALRADELEQAIIWLERASEANPADGAALTARIEAHARLDQHELAETVFYLAQEMAPQHAPLYIAMADSLLDRKRHDKAVWCLREAGRIDPSCEGLRPRLARAYAATGRHERARQLLMLELRSFPGDLDTLLEIGQLLVDMERYDEAGEKLRRVLELEPDHAEAHFMLGDAAERQGDAMGAMRQYEIVLRLEPDYPEVRQRVASIIMERVRIGMPLTEARPADISLAQRMLIAELREVREQPGDFGDEELERLASLLLESGLRKESIEVCDMLIARTPGRWAPRHAKSVAMFESGDLFGGIITVRQALSIEPRLVPAIHNLALAYLRLGQWLRARYWIRQGIAIDPDDRDLRRLRVRLRMRAIGDLARGLIRIRPRALRKEIP